MLAIPIPFIVSLLLALLAAVLLARLGRSARTTALFLLLCAITTGVVGLRWTFDLALLTLAQPILASLIPVAAWHIFSQAKAPGARVSWLHGVGPALVALGMLTHNWLPLPLDGLLTAIYLCYGIALVRFTDKTQLLYVSFNEWEGVRRTEHIAGWMLLFSTAIDATVSLDFAFNQGQLAPYILSLGHLMLVPMLAAAVVMVGVNTPDAEEEEMPASEPEPAEKAPLLSDDRAREIVAQLDNLMKEKACYLDPELTLARLSRKLGIPAKQISSAVNLVRQQSIPRVINEYRIAHARQALLNTDESITQILMNAGFQTKSNFNREFQRITGLTPSQFRARRDLSAAS
ncbi:helix-turn-helix domain-containing protein [Aeromonas sp. s5]|uniref:helix-turn-helix domain-containing protein n=1 Tax=Aeromonas sp. s5 TaxID=3138487 RepID=UPI0034A4497E